MIFILVQVSIKHKNVANTANTDKTRNSVNVQINHNIYLSLCSICQLMLKSISLCLCVFIVVIWAICRKFGFKSKEICLEKIIVPKQHFQLFKSYLYIYLICRRSTSNSEQKAKATTSDARELSEPGPSTHNINPS